MGIGGKCFEESTRLVIPPRTQEQSRQGNHAVPSPVGEPGIAGNDRLKLGGEMPLSTIRLAISRTRRASDDKLISGKYQPGKDWISLWQGIFGLIRRRQELLDALLVARPGLLHGHFMLRATKFSLQLRLRAEDNRHTLPWRHLQAKCAGLIHILAVGQAALCVTPVLHTPEPVPCRGVMGR